MQTVSLVSEYVNGKRNAEACAQAAPPEGVRGLDPLTGCPLDCPAETAWRLENRQAAFLADLRELGL